MEHEKAEGITTQQFMIKLWKRFKEEEKKNQRAFFQAGIVKGWLEEADFIGAGQAIERRIAARIIHQFLRIECGEPDEEKWQSVSDLKDLYDCRTCVNHVAQVFTKGIMTGKLKNLSDQEQSENEQAFIFGMRDGLSEEESDLIIARMFDKALRLEVSQKSKGKCGAKKISYEEAQGIMYQKAAVLVDVRTEEAYKRSHLPYAINKPLASILQNSKLLGEDQTTAFILYCELGYQSEIGARCLIEAGYEQIYYFGEK